MKRLFALFTALALTLVVAPSPAVATPAHGAAIPVQGRWVVGLSRPSGRSQSSATARVEALGGQVDTRSPAGDAIVVNPGPGVQGAAVLASLRAAPGVRYVEPVVARHISADGRTGAGTAAAAAAANARVSLVPTDPAYPAQWGLARIGAPTAWDITLGSRDVTIAVIDTGVDYAAPDLAGRIDTAEARNFTVNPATSNADDDSWDAGGEGHGTHVAGIAAAALGNGVAGVGVAPRCTVLPVKVFDRNGNGDSFRAAQGLRWAADHHASVINMSYGGPTYTRTEADAVAYALSKGCVLVAAAGNDGNDAAEYPAAYPGVLAVSATDPSDQLAWFSDFGGAIDLAAPGTGIVSLASSRSGLATATMSGTSMAAPFVAGVAALVRSDKPSLTNLQTMQQLTGSAGDLGAAGWDPAFGAGLARADLAVSSVVTTHAVTYPELGGTTRYETAATIARAAFPRGAGSVIVATGDNYPDALGASALAGVYRAPILLVPTKGAVPAAVLDTVRALGAGRAVILGGTGAVSDASALQIKKALGGTRPRTIRLAGADRYATALAVARQVKRDTGAAWTREAFLVSGTSFSDALSLSPLSYRAHQPILLAPRTAAGWAALSSAVGGGDLDVGRMPIVGDESRVTGAIETDIHGLPSWYAGRLSADAGLPTSLLVANLAREYGMSFDHVAFARSDIFADGLAGGPLQGELGSFILVVPGTSLPQAARYELGTHRKEIYAVDFLGGTGAIGPTLRAQVADTLSR